MAKYKTANVTTVRKKPQVVTRTANVTTVRKLPPGFKYMQLTPAQMKTYRKRK